MTLPFIHTISYPGLYHYPASRSPPFFPPSDTEDSSGRKFSAHSGSSSGHGDGDGDLEPIKMNFYPSDSYSCGDDSDFYRINAAFYGNISGTFDESLASVFGGTDKQTMKDLNGRLAKYLEKVRSLRESNTELERKILEWYENKEGLTAASMQRDCSNYYTTIGELRAKILAACKENAERILQVDNLRLAADDFKHKYENELILRQTVEADINGLRRVMDDLTLSNSDLEIQVESLADELESLKKNHEEELKGVKTQQEGTLSVMMNAAPGEDLLKSINDMRQQYEALAEKHRKLAEEEFQAATKDLVKQVATDSQATQSAKSEVSSIRQNLQSLEIELASQLSMKSSLEATLAETEGRYCAQIAQLQSRIAGVEEELANLRSEMEHQSEQYNILLDIKTRLEQEIGTYRNLLDGTDTKVSGGDSKQNTTSSTSSRTSSTSRIR